MDGAKKAIIFGLVAIMVLPFCFAAEPSMDEICIAKGFSYGVSRWFWINDSFFETDYLEEYDVFVEGNARRINWTSDTYIDGVIFKTTRTYTSDGGFNGTIPKTSLSSDLNYVLFCNNDVEIPEFGVLGLIFASSLGLLLTVTRRK